MKLDIIIAGAYENNCYIIRSNNNTQYCVLIDTALESEPIIAFLNKNKLDPAALLLTHGHADHIAAIPALKKNRPEMKIYIHSADAQMLTSPQKNLSMFAGKPVLPGPADVLVCDNQELNIADMTFRVLHTPGHTDGGVCYYLPSENIVFTGDTLFDGSIGRTDFPGYDIEKKQAQLIEGIKSRLLTLPADTVIYPGHGTASTIYRQIRTNPYLT